MNILRLPRNVKIVITWGLDGRFLQKQADRNIASYNLAWNFINTDMEVLIWYQIQFFFVVMEKPAVFYEGMDMESAYKI